MYQQHKHSRWMFAGVLFLALALAFGAVGARQVSAAGAIQRPLSDWLSVQGTYSSDPNTGSSIISWTDPSTNDWNAAVDYAGIADKFAQSICGSSLGTQISGKVTELPLADGRARVHVDLVTKHALTFVFNAPWDPTAPLLFGHFPVDVCAGAEAAYSNSHLLIDFYNPYPGAPMRDFVEVAFASSDLIDVYFQSNGSGPLRAEFGVPDGTPGRLQVAETGTLFRTPFIGKGTQDGFPAEVINLLVTGH